MSKLYIRDKSGNLVPVESISTGGGGITVIRESNFLVEEEAGTVLETKLTPAEFLVAAAGGMELQVLSDDQVEWHVYRLYNYEETGGSAIFVRGDEYIIYRISIIISNDGTMTVHSIGNQGLGGAAVDTDQLKQQIINAIYPVGAIYISYTSTSPAILFGGSWTQIQGRFLLAESQDYQAGTMGGEEAHALTEAEMPAHKHSADFWSSKSGDAGYTGTPATNYDSWNRPTERATASVKATGGGQAHNNMPPYEAYYCWKRIA